MNTPHIVMIGAGFGGLNVARQLRGAPVRLRCAEMLSAAGMPRS